MSSEHPLLLLFLLSSSFTYIFNPTYITADHHSDTHIAPLTLYICTVTDTLSYLNKNSLVTLRANHTRKKSFLNSLLSKTVWSPLSIPAPTCTHHPTLNCNICSLMLLLNVNTSQNHLTASLLSCENLHSPIFCCFHFRTACSCWRWGNSKTSGLINALQNHVD